MKPETEYQILLTRFRIKKFLQDQWPLLGHTRGGGSFALCCFLATRSFFKRSSHIWFSYFYSHLQQKKVLHASWSKFEIAVIPLVLLRYLPSVYVALKLFFFSFFFAVCLFSVSFVIDITQWSNARGKNVLNIFLITVGRKNLSQLPIGNRCGSMNPGLS